jgi:hypothetical protein
MLTALPLASQRTKLFPPVPAPNLVVHRPNQPILRRDGYNIFESSGEATLSFGRL